MRYQALRKVAIICTLVVAAHLPSFAEDARFREDARYRVTIKTTALLTSSAAPFSIALVLTDGSAIQDGKSSVRVEHLRFGRGYPLGDPVVFGGARGIINSRVTLTNSAPVSFYVQSFEPGRELSFDLSVIRRKGYGGLPCRLSVFLLDRSGTAIATLAPVGDFFLALDLKPTGAKPETFGSNPAVLPFEGRAIVIPTPWVED